MNYKVFFPGLVLVMSGAGADIGMSLSVSTTKRMKKQLGSVKSTGDEEDPKVKIKR